MQQDFLSDVELYYSNKVVGDKIEIDGEEHHHIKDVMRHSVSDEIFVTDGIGNIYKTKIAELGKKHLIVEITSEKSYEKKLANITFCIPRLRSADRFEFALEKCVELGITSFIIFDSKRTIAKGEKLERWQKILNAAMKQSLRAWLPEVFYAKNVEQLFRKDGFKIIFDQNAEQLFTQYLSSAECKMKNEKCFLIFGPEGGLSNEEIKNVNADLKIRLTDIRLRSETAIIAAATELVFRLAQ